MTEEVIKLPTDYQTYIHKSRYARWLEEEGRRETWDETVDRYINYFRKKFENNEYVQQKLSLARKEILELNVMPSMRCLMTAGPALDRDNVAAFNCSYLAINRLRAFDEAMYVLMCGTGVGFSVEKKYVEQLPTIEEEFHETDTTIIVRDSKLGWVTAFRELISLLYSGRIPRWDTSRVRPAGARLKTFGGRASGPEPLEDLFNFATRLISSAAGRKLTSIECHDLMCKIAEIVVVGGVRRSALISLSDLEDEKMRLCKHGQWWNENPQRALANNSAVYQGTPDVHLFLKEWTSLYDSKSGERGIFNRASATAQAAKNGRRDTSFDFGTNPCSEIILRDRQFCNLTEVVIRPSDSEQDLRRKCRVAAFLGTLQASLTNFRYLSKEWKKNTEEEALLGVSLTGIEDHPVMSMKKSDAFSLAELLEDLKEETIEENAITANEIGINVSTAITCVKPSGTVSQLCDSSSGIHPRYSRFYIRSVRSDNKDPLTVFLKEQGVPNEPDNLAKDSVTVFYFPMKSPDHAVLRDEVSAIEQLDLWKIYAEHWCEHKPSITVYVRENEWIDVAAWVYKNFDSVSGISFLPYDNGTYKQAPYQEIDEETYSKLVKEFPKIDWSKFYETEDNTVGANTLACTAGACEI